MQQVEASAVLIDEMIQEVARELFLDAAVAHVMGEQHPCVRAEELCLRQAVCWM